VNSSHSRQFEELYRRLWAALHRGDEAEGLGQHERALLAHVGSGVSLTWLARHLLLAKSTASVLVKDLERRGYLRRERDPGDERRLRITLTPAGERAVAADTVLEPAGLAAAMETLEPAERTRLLALLDRLVRAAETAREP
jgi:DNA-binding MarR family transcriptional regulator